jgi:ferredoxin-type protein NapG
MDARCPSRRTFIVAMAALVTGVATGGAGAVAMPTTIEASVLRPPGSLPEADFIARCIRCERCISVCPEDVLEPIGIEGGPTMRTPKLDYAEGACTFCDKCREVCPTAAITEVDPYRPDLGRIGVAVISPERCLAYEKTGSCGICVDACPYDALSLDGERHPRVEESLCNGCGECVRICPANVLTSFGGSQMRGVDIVTEKTYQTMDGAS